MTSEHKDQIEDESEDQGQNYDENGGGEPNDWRERLTYWIPDIFKELKRQFRELQVVRLHYRYWPSIFIDFLKDANRKQEVACRSDPGPIASKRRPPSRSMVRHSATATKLLV